MNTVTIYDPNNSGSYVQFIFEKSSIENHCEISLHLQDDSKVFESEKLRIHFCQIIKMANWYNGMPTGSETSHPDLVIPALHLKFTNYYFEKGEGVYYLIYETEKGDLFKFQFWEQLGNSNAFIYHEFMKCLDCISKM